MTCLQCRQEVGRSAYLIRVNRSVSRSNPSTRRRRSEVELLPPLRKLTVERSPLRRVSLSQLSARSTFSTPANGELSSLMRTSSSTQSLLPSPIQRTSWGLIGSESSYSPASEPSAHCSLYLNTFA